MAFNYPLQYSDDEDCAAFGDDVVRRRIFHKLLNPIKNNTPGSTELDFPGYCHGHPLHPDAVTFIGLEWSIAAWRRIARFVGNNDHVEELDLNECSLTCEKLEALFEGLRENRSLKRLLFGSNENVGAVELIPLLAPYLRSNNNLVDLGLSNMGLSAEHLQTLVSALEDTHISRLDLRKNNFGVDDRMVDLIPMVIHSSQPGLQELKLSECRIGRKGCLTMAQLLQEKDSKLKLLYLDYNDLDDECCSILTASLQNNTVLKILNLDDNNRITETGLDYFLQLLGAKSCIRSTYHASNHTLSGLSEEDQYLAILDEWDSEVHRRVLCMLKANCENNDQDAARKKVELIHFNGLFDVLQILDLNIMLMPRLLAWFSNDSKCVQRLYRIIRHWDVSTLLGTPSMESATIDARMVVGGDS